MGNNRTSGSLQRRLLGLAISSIFLVSFDGCGRIKVISHDPSYGFIPLIDKCYVLSRGALLSGPDKSGKHWLQGLSSKSVNDLNEFDNGFVQGGYSIIDPGRKIQLNRLEYHPPSFSQNDIYQIYGRFVDGPFQGKEIRIGFDLINSDQSQPNGEPSHWKVNTENLTPCDKP
jgi:hypothetical protein